MTVNLSFLLLGLTLLFFPRQWMRLGATILSSRRKANPADRDPRDDRSPGDPRVSFKREFVKGRNYFDLLRGAVGGIAILGGLNIPSSMTLAEDGTAIQVWQLYTIKLVIITAGLLIQTVRYERRRIVFFAPVFYLSGLSLALTGSWAALFSFILIWAINPMVPSAHGFLVAYGIFLLGFGLLLHQVGLVLPVAGFFFCFTPVLLSWLAKRPLVVFTRKPVHSPARA